MNKYETKDIWKASALLSMGFSCSAERLAEKQFMFIFEETPEVLEAVGKYERNKLTIDVETLSKSYKKLKNLTFNH